MQRITIMGLTMLATFAIVCVGAVSVSASGSEFIASTTGKVKDKQTNVQVFKLGSGGSVECAEVTGYGEITELKSVTNKEVLTYSGCSGGGPVKVSPAYFEFNANGSAKLEKTVTVVAEGGAGCEVVLEPQTLEKVAYSNTSSGITATAKVKNVHSKGTGGGCGTTNTEDTYTGSIAAELEGGGKLEWK